jgi:hypothetical protein
MKRIYKPGKDYTGRIVLPATGPKEKAVKVSLPCVDVNKRYNDTTFHQLISNGRRRNACFQSL